MFARTFAEGLNKSKYVSYNAARSDQFTRWYSYDSDNMLTKVQTSSDRFVWCTDEQYYYYLHGLFDAREKNFQKLFDSAKNLDKINAR